MSDKKQGTVKFFNTEKGFGFIQPDGGNNRKDDFVHVTALQASGLKSLNEGDRVEYTMEEQRGKACAANVTKLAK